MVVVLLHSVHVVVEAAKQFAFKLEHSVALGHIAEPGFSHLEGRFVGHGEDVDPSHLHLEYDRSVILFHPKTHVALHRVALRASILGKELLHDCLGHEDEVNALSEAFLDLKVLPQELERNIS